ncbi:uncharacterized protein [Nicotiana tomentosiformis]|uniref:uncharacterized protein n=1 Tax=Nicotiana tomentosiformis TaxID=4098 RepID=UPI00051B56FE|nr:uncharacterized protein LOC104115283 [Nicotiana tomentosiformis]
MFDALLKSKFYTKCKSVIKLTKTRIEMIRKKREAMLKYLKNDMVDLLKSGLDVNAYNRAEGLMFELNISICYDMLEHNSLHISSHLAIMSKQRVCPEDCREAASTLMFAAARFSDLPELRGLRATFTERYGNSLELFVNKEFVEKLKSQPPTKEMKLQLMRDIAVESGIKWNSRDLEQKLYKQLMSEQGRPKSHNDEEHKLHKKMDESARSKEHEDSKLNHENVRQHTTSKAKREHHSSYGRKEVPGDVHSLPKGRDSDKQKRDNLSRASNRNLDDIPPIKDGRKWKQNEPDISSCVSKEESDDKKPFYYRSFQPNYTKSRACITNSSSDVSPTCSTEEAQKHTEMTQMKVQLSKEEGTCVNDTIKKPKPKSVRRTRLQPMHGSEEDSDRLKGEERGKSRTSGVKDNGKHGIRITKGDHHDQRDEEEKMMDRLLLHYTRKQLQNEIQKPKSVVKLPKLAEVDAGEVSRQRFPNGPSGRAAITPIELKQASSVALRVREGHTQANSFEHDMLSPNGHIHPKLPEYDDFITRLRRI